MTVWFILLKVISIYIDRQTSSQADMQVGRQLARQTDRQTYIHINTVELINLFIKSVL